MTVDWEAAKRDPFAFSAEVLGHPMTAWQAEGARLAVRPASFTATVAGRQTGKTTTAAVVAVWTAARRRDRAVLIVSGGGEAGAKRVLAIARRLAVRSGVLRGSVVDESGSRLELDNGSVILAVPATDAAVRGITADLVIVDEAQSVPDDFALSAVLPTIAATGGSVWAIGTAGRASGWFYDWCRRGEVGEPGYVSFRWVSNLIDRVGGVPTPWLSPTLLSMLRSALGSVRAQAELEARFVEGGDFLFSPAELDRVTADFRADSLTDLRGPAGVWAGLDFGISRDRSALVALGRPVLGRGEPLRLAVRCSHVWELGHPVAGPGGVLSDVAGSRAVLEHLMADGTGTQAAIVQALGPLLRGRDPRLGGGRPRGGPVVVNDAELDEDQLRALVRRRNADRLAWPSTRLAGVIFSAQSKQAMYGTAKWAVGEGLLLLSSSQTELRRDLLAVRVGLNASGGERFEATGSDHDDLADALVLALRPYRRKRDGAWRTVAGDLLQSGATTPEYAPEGLLAAGEVRTGGGLVLPRAPTWASPARARAGMSVPAEVEGWRPPPDPRLAGVAARVRAALEQEHDHDEHAEVM